MSLTDLPIDAVLPDILHELRQAPNVVLQAPPGTGKTTRVPPAILDAGLAGPGQIFVLQPRRLAATTAARRIAFERGTELGGEIGYHVRFDRRASRDTRIIVATEGILLRFLHEDPFLERASVVIFDEFHERNLPSDLALAMLRRVQREFRSDLKLVVMSATLQADPVAKYLDCRVVRSEGRSFPVDIRYLRFTPSQPLAESVAAGVREYHQQQSGDTLVFLPGVGEIRRAKGELATFAEQTDCSLLELYGDLPAAKQDEVIRPARRRKIILSTNVAETSVTIDGVDAVIDSGLARILRFSPSVGLNRLELSRISQAAADQRAGRAGRTRPGACLRLWTESEQRAMREVELPEVQRSDLSEALLHLYCWGGTTPHDFPWFEKPPPAAWKHAEQLLEWLGAVHDGQLLPLGRAMGQFPLAPRLARMLLEASASDCVADAAMVAAMLSERDPFLRQQEGRGGALASESDVLDRLAALHAFERKTATSGTDPQLDPAAARSVLRVRDQLLRLCEIVLPRDARSTIHGLSQTPLPDAKLPDAKLLPVLLAAFPDRVAKRREPGSRRAVMVGGRGVELSPRSRVKSGELVLCVDVEEQGRGEAFVRQASLVQRSWLASHLVDTRTELEFDDSRERVVAFRRIRYLDLLLDESPTDAAEPRRVAELLAAAASERLERALALADEPVATFLSRVHCLRDWMPELQLPPFDEQQIRELLPTLCAGIRSFAELRKRPLIDWLQSQLTDSQRAALDREAPERLEVPSGNRIRLQYEIGRPPVLAVRIQEVFGLKETPRVAGGRIAVLLHLLAPNMRPQQVTDDLASFWARGYSVIRKELRARYPKHAWPEDPSNAEP